VKYHHLDLKITTALQKTEGQDYARSVIALEGPEGSR
jgi:hypothetical protein